MNDRVERLDGPMPDCITKVDQAVNNLVHHGLRASSSKTRSRPLQCNSARYTSALKYQGESHHSLRSIDPAPNPTLRID